MRRVKNLNVNEFRELLLELDTLEFSNQIISQNDNWYFDRCEEIEDNITYEIFRETVANHINLAPEQVALVGSSVYGFSLSPKIEKTFGNFHENSDLDLAIISEELFEKVWKELLEAYHRGYGWVMQRHSSEIFRQFALLISDGKYKTTVLRDRVKLLDGISKKIYIRTGSSRPLKYRIYRSRDAVIEYHASGLRKIKRRLEDDA
ncbi:hypothetical protein JQX09_07280 [Sulfitobacter pseudonitzschiae]|uniref:Uncharacterized protein n=1 Tax=Pseudosulfitobacter pseudonitzschiae TaxID=1402135 RepID=A0A9Q2NLE5_9RHOB|nr:hypothetical protein [Pseudosulfitobacter pseudonitzschiae]MBM2291706.1 hypothetical protein [Pseudosulfitobacter pseudonitzschiae]MBM2296624.1 hypothetical protein [Pseudosulfitobacter pseudonitzschiae]MBM2301537.1 hypothetical protein [Pseudosulfitobacter pseudonitzschiae]MBM2311321.1 hypothetical protein [Pseudosulfitobacter pseudonitzschiae]MBM2316234.1 hypothetical protein [Pseudosulfitobacter pseudonitzschiae]